MTMMADILNKRWPNAEWSIKGNDYNTLVWYDTNSQSKPTLDEILSQYPSVEIEMKWDKVRTERDRLLAESDWTQLNDCPLEASTKTQWTLYRQELRDVPQDQTDPDNINWPSTP